MLSTVFTSTMKTMKSCQIGDTFLHYLVKIPVEVTVSAINVLVIVNVFVETLPVTLKNSALGLPEKEH